VTARLALGLLTAWLASQGALAHEVRPGYLELQQTAEERWNVLWKVPAQGDLRLSIHPRFPEGCAAVSEPIAFQANAAYVERTSIACRGGLAGRTIAVEGLAATMTDVLVRSVRADGSVQVARLTPSAPGFAFEAAPGSFEVAHAYTLLGVEQSFAALVPPVVRAGADAPRPRQSGLPGRRPSPHSRSRTAVTLAAATLGWMRVSQAAGWQAVIALSILFARSRARQAGPRRAGPDRIASRGSSRFVFGLLHGVSASRARCARWACLESDVPLALLTFNVGVELGQLHVHRRGCVLVPGPAGQGASAVTRMDAHVDARLRRLVRWRHSGSFNALAPLFP
jgi:hypothetical protein